MAGVVIPGPSPKDLSRQILAHKAPEYNFAFSPFLFQTYRHGVSPNRPVCKAFLQGHCPLGPACPDKHTSANTNSNFNNLVYECLYLHIDPNSKLPPCPHYEKGFCPLGPRCSKKHVRKAICEFYLAGFCPDGKNCKKAHPRWPTDLPKPTVRVERDADDIAEEQARLRENAEREEEKEREKFGGGRGGRWGGGFGGRGRGGSQGQGRQRGRGHY
ncbi:hypothetical protein B7463_g3624, partial [Scytalidium lignicola]